jgi:uncharacterized protein
MRVLPVLAVLLGVTFTGCLGGGDASDPNPGDAPRRLSVAEWTAKLSRPIYSDFVSTVHQIEAADGTPLGLTLHLPAGLPAGATIPTLMEITPYQAFLAVEYNLPGLGTPGPGSSWRFYVERGAAYVEADARGTTRSGGCLDFGGSADRSDAAAFVAWVRAQPWSNGVVVTDGISHPGMGSVVAHAGVPDLQGALTHAPVVDYYRDEWYQGAKFEDQVNGPAYQAVELGPALDTNPSALTAQAAPCTGKTALDFNSLDGRHGDLWDDRDLSRHVEQARAPILLTQGFVDQNVHPDHVQLYWDALPDDAPKAVIWGWWYHGWPDLEGHPAEEFAALRHRWLDTLLFGVDNGLAAEPRVLVEDSKGTWHEGHDWPLEPSEQVTLWTEEGDLVPSAVASGRSAYNDAPGAYRGEWANAHVAFRTEPLTEPRLVNGAPVVDLVASSTATATKWVVYLMDEAPDGSWQRITHGYADSHTWAGEDEWRDLVPGQAYNWTVQLMPTAVVVEAGHRVTLVVASQDSRRAGLAEQVLGMSSGGCFDDYRGGCYSPSGILPAPESASVQATNTVMTGPGGTRVHLHWVDPALTAKVPAA